MQEQSIFIEALEREDPAERAAFLDQACAGDAALRERIERLLALDHLAAASPQAAELVKLRYFAGFSNAEAASVLGVSPRKANQIWAYARAWLREELGDDERG